MALDLDKTFGSRDVRHALIYGAAWQQRDVDFIATDYRWNNAGTLDSATVDPGQIPKTDARAWNLYLRDSIALLDDRLGINLGLRYDRYDYSPRIGGAFQDGTGTVRDLSFSSPTWQAGVSYELVPDHTLWFQTGRGFRAPTVGELYAPTSVTELVEVATGNVVNVPTNAANPDLDAETSLNLELGWRWETDVARLGVSVFRDRYEDFIETLRLTANPDTEYRSCVRGTCTTRFGYDYNTQANVGEVTVTGVEVEGLWRLGDAWLLRTAFSRNRGEQKDGSPLDSINPARGVAGLSGQRRVRAAGVLVPEQVMDGVRPVRQLPDLRQAASERRRLQPVRQALLPVGAHPQRHARRLLPLRLCHRRRHRPLQRAGTQLPGHAVLQLLIQKHERRCGNLSRGGSHFPSARASSSLTTLEKSSPPLPALLLSEYRLRASSPSGIDAPVPIAASAARPRSFSIRSLPKPPL